MLDHARFRIVDWGHIPPLIPLDPKYKNIWREEDRLAAELWENSDAPSHGMGRGRIKLTRKTLDGKSGKIQIWILSIFLRIVIVYFYTFNRCFFV